MSSNETGLQSFGTHFIVFSSMAGLLVFMSIFKLPKPISHCCISAVILPSLQRLHGDLSELDATGEEDHCFEMVVKKKLDDKRKVSDMELEREDECGICLEPCNKVVLPNCCHAMCINCYRNWSLRSESCPFCRGSLKRVTSGDLWVLTRSIDVVETKTVLKEDILRFHLYINKLPKDLPDALFVMYYEYLI
ncbi:hypothetical protein ES319_A03G074700v1 [Gossypium barbadense]|uniref:RING-type domain-containing protein n=1 Tax=Gossypium barbadense TaxID=3634 RepID=A0A5J5WAF1_GOSBA|nr:hypothetical protein ES319_A03G074700v1 [Gossypium barbadense]